MKNWWDQLTFGVGNFREARRGTRIGFVDVEIDGLSLRLADCVLHRHPKTGRCWVQPPARVLETRDGRPAVDPLTGRPRFKGVFRFRDKAVGRRVSNRIVAFLQAQHPDVFGGWADEDTSEEEEGDGNLPF